MFWLRNRKYCLCTILGGLANISFFAEQDDKGLKNGLRKAMVGLPEGVSLTHDLIRDQIPGLPKLFEFWEGMGKSFCI